MLIFLYYYNNLFCQSTSKWGLETMLMIDQVKIKLTAIFR
jgi:hypothetical protein